jgi:hypothetical protein
MDIDIARHVLRVSFKSAREMGEQSNVEASDRCRGFFVIPPGRSSGWADFRSFHEWKD